MASRTQWTWIWANSWTQWRAGKPGRLQSMGSQRAGHDLPTGQHDFSSGNMQVRKRAKWYLKYLKKKKEFCVWQNYPSKVKEKYFLRQKRRGFLTSRSVSKEQLENFQRRVRKEWKGWKKFSEGWRQEAAITGPCQALTSLFPRREGR